MLASLMALLAACAGTRVEDALSYHPNGRLRSAELVAPRRVQGKAFPERARLYFRADGTLERAEYVEREGHEYGLPRWWEETAYVTYDPSGEVTSYRVERTETIYPCEDGTP